MKLHEQRGGQNQRRNGVDGTVQDPKLPKGSNERVAETMREKTGDFLCTVRRAALEILGLNCIYNAITMKERHFSS